MYIHVSFNAVCGRGDLKCIVAHVRDKTWPQYLVDAVQVGTRMPFVLRVLVNVHK